MILPYRSDFVHCHFELSIKVSPFFLRATRYVPLYGKAAVYVTSHLPMGWLIFLIFSYYNIAGKN